MVCKSPSKSFDVPQTKEKISGLGLKVVKKNEDFTFLILDSKSSNNEFWFAIIFSYLE